MAVVRGGTQYEGGRFSTWDVLLGYAVAGLLGGVLLGILKPLLASRLGAVTAGIAVGPIVYGSVALAVEGPAKFSLPLVLFLGVFAGAVAGYQFGKWKN